MALAALAVLQAAPLPTPTATALSLSAADAQSGLVRAGLEAPALATLSLDPGASLFRAAHLLAMLAVAAAVARRAAGAPLAAAASLVVVAAGQAAIGLAQHFMRHESLAAAGSYVNRNHFAGLMEIALPPAAGLALILARRAAADPRTPRIAAASAASLAAAAILFALLTSYSRGAFLALTAALFAVAAATAVRRRSWVSRIGRMGPAAGGAAAIAFLLALAPPALVERFERSGEEIRDGGRVELWGESLAAAADHLALGCGFGAYETCFAPYKRLGAAYRDDFAHNDYLQVAVELGLPALAAALLALGSLVRTGLGAAFAKRSTESSVWALSAFASITALLVHSLVDFNLYIPANGIAFAVVCGLLAAAAPVHKDSAPGGR